MKWMRERRHFRVFLYCLPLLFFFLGLGTSNGKREKMIRERMKKEENFIQNRRKEEKYKRFVSQ